MRIMEWVKAIVNKKQTNMIEIYKYFCEKNDLIKLIQIFIRNLLISNKIRIIIPYLSFQLYDRNL